MKPHHKGIAICGIVGIVSLSIGLGAAYGWPYGLICFGAFALLISWAAA